MRKLVKKHFGLVIDWETTGIHQQEVPWNAYLDGPQGIELGAIVVELPDFTTINETVTRVRFLGTAHGVSYGGPTHENLTWSDEAERVHGISVTDLINEPTPSEAADKLVRFVLQSTRIEDPQKSPIMVCGHNPAGDMYYLRQLLFLGSKERGLRFHHRMLDSFTLGYMMLGTKSSNDLFEQVSGVVRDKHNALQDARLTRDAFVHLYNKCRNFSDTPLQ
jgi:DNA polymerase III epsilon subunit-like protein